MTNDPSWASEMGVSEAKLWEQRAKAQLERARTAEKKVSDLETEVRHMRAFTEVEAVGERPIDAIKALAKRLDWGDVDEGSLYDLPDDDDSEYDWGCGFRAGGTGFKAAGKKVPGGYTLTWWK